MKILENRNLKIGFFFSLLTLVVSVLLFTFGIRTAIMISEFFQKSKPLPSENLYSNVVPAPQLFSLPEATNSATLAISGFSLPNEKVDLYLNDLNVKTLDTDSEGKFENELSLSLGMNKIYAVTTDHQGQKSPASPAWSIYYNDSPPALEVTEPISGSLIRGPNNSATLKGKIEKNSRVTINDHLVILSDDGSFSYPVKLEVGENHFKVICLDPAQNKNELDWVIRYQP